MATTSEPTSSAGPTSFAIERPPPRRPPGPDEGSTWASPAGGSRRRDGDEFVPALGWLSVALGAAALLAPRRVGRLIGLPHPLLLRAVGLREFASAFGLLANPQRADQWLQSRVAGDLMDLSLLGVALRPGNPLRSRAAIAAAAVASVLAVDVYASRRLARSRPATQGRMLDDGSFHVAKSLLVNASPEQCYETWRDFEGLPRFMKHLQRVEILDEKRTRWVAKGPAGLNAEWEAETTSDVPGREIGWRSLPGSRVRTSGHVRFESVEGRRGTLVRVDLRYRAPAGALGAEFAKLWGEEPTLQIPEDLRRFKRLLEAGEIPTTEGQPHGRRSLIGKTFTRMAS